MKCPNCNHRFDYFKFGLPEWIPEEAWKNWVDYRKFIKRPMNDRAMKLSVRKLEKLKGEGYKPEDVIDYSISSGKWWGLYEPKDKQQEIIINRERKHEAEKAKREVPRNGNTLSVEDQKRVEDLNKELLEIGRRLIGASADDKFNKMSRVNEINKELKNLKDKKMSINSHLCGFDKANGR